MTATVRAWAAGALCDAPTCGRTGTHLVTVHDVGIELPELVDVDGTLRFLVCPDHAAVIPADAVFRDAIGTRHPVRVMEL